LVTEWGSSRWHERRIWFTRTSNAATVGADKDSEKRPRPAIEAFATRAGYAVAEDDWFYDADVNRAYPVTGRPGFKAMPDRIAGQWGHSSLP